MPEWSIPFFGVLLFLFYELRQHRKHLSEEVDRAVNAKIGEVIGNTFIQLRGLELEASQQLERVRQQEESAKEALSRFTEHLVDLDELTKKIAETRRLLEDFREVRDDFEKLDQALVDRGETGLRERLRKRAAARSRWWRS